MDNDYVLGVGIDDSGVVKGLDNILSLVTKFGDNNVIKQLKGIQVNFNNESLKVAHNQYVQFTKDLQKTSKQAAKSLHIQKTNADGDYVYKGLVPKGGINDLDRVQKLIADLRKNRDAVFDSKGNPTSAKFVDDMIRQMEMAIKVTKDYSTVLKKAWSEVEHLNNIEKSKSMMMGGEDKETLQRNLQLLKGISVEYDKLYKLTNNQKYKDLGNEVRDEISVINQIKKEEEARAKAAERKIKLEVETNKKIDELRARLKGPDGSEVPLEKQKKTLEQLIVLYQKLYDQSGKNSDKIKLGKAEEELSVINRKIDFQNKLAKGQKEAEAQRRKAEEIEARIVELQNKRNLTFNTELERLKNVESVTKRIIAEYERLEKAKGINLQPTIQAEQWNLSDTKQKIADLKEQEKLQARIKTIEDQKFDKASLLRTAEVNDDYTKQIQLLNQLIALEEKLSYTANKPLDRTRVAELKAKLNQARENKRISEETNAVERQKLQTLQQISNLERQLDDAPNQLKGNALIKEEIKLVQELIKLYRSKQAQESMPDSQRYSKIGELQHRLNNLQTLNRLEDNNNKLLRQKSGLFEQLKRYAAQYISVFAVTNLGRKIAEITGYFEQQKVALQGIIQDTPKALALFDQLKSFSVKSPFEFKDLVSYTKQLSAFQIPVDELFDTTKRLADVSAGLGVDMSRIILAYGQVRSAAVLRGQELRQFTEAGIPLVDELAKRFSILEGRVISTGDVFQRISERGVSFKMVKDILFDLSDEGGKFYDMQEKISRTVYGQIVNMKDAANIAFDEMGRSADSFINKFLSGMRTIFENWRTSLLTISGLMAGLGAQGFFAKAGGMANLNQSLIDANKKANILNKTLMGTKLIMQGIGNMIKANALGVLIAALGFIIGRIKDLQAKSNELRNELRQLDNEFSSRGGALVANFKELAKQAVESANGSEAQAEALEKLKTKYSEYLPLSKLTLDSLRKETDGYKELTKAILARIEAEKFETKRQRMLEKANEEIGTTGKTLNTASTTRLGQGIYSEVGRISEAERDILIKRIEQARRLNVDLLPEEKIKKLEEIFKNFFGESADYQGLKDLIGQLLASENQLIAKNQDLFADNRYSDVTNDTNVADYATSIEWKKKLIELDENHETQKEENREKALSEYESVLNFMNEQSLMEKYFNQLKVIGIELTKEEQAMIDNIIGLKGDEKAMYDEIERKKKDGKQITRDEEILLNKIVNTRADGFLQAWNQIINRVDTANGSLALTLSYMNSLTNNQSWGAFANIKKPYAYEQSVNDYITNNAINTSSEVVRSILTTMKMKPQDDYNAYTAGLKTKYDNEMAFLNSQTNKTGVDPVLQEKIDVSNQLIDHYKNIANQLNFNLVPTTTPKTRTPRSSQGSKADPFVAAIKKRVDAIKEAKEAYDKVTTTTSRTKAVEIISGFGNDAISQFFTGKSSETQTDRMSVIGGYDTKYFGDAASGMVDWYRAIEAEIARLPQTTDVQKRAVAELRAEYEKWKALDEVSLAIQSIERSVEALNDEFSKNEKAREFFQILTDAGAPLQDAITIANRTADSFSMLESKFESLRAKMAQRLRIAGYDALAEEVMQALSSTDIDNIITKVKAETDITIGKGLSENATPVQIKNRALAESVVSDITSMGSTLKDYYFEEYKQVLNAFVKFKQYDAQREASLSNSVREVMDLERNIKRMTTEIDRNPSLTAEEKNARKEQLNNLLGSASSESIRTARQSYSQAMLDELVQSDDMTLAINNMEKMTIESINKIIQKIDNLLTSGRAGSLTQEQTNQLQGYRTRLNDNVRERSGIAFSEIRRFFEERDRKATERNQLATNESSIATQLSVARASRDTLKKRMDTASPEENSILAAQLAIEEKALLELEIKLKNIREQIDASRESTAYEDVKGFLSGAGTDAQALEQGLQGVAGMFSEIQSISTGLQQAFAGILSKEDLENWEELNTFLSDVGDAMTIIIAPLTLVIALIIGVSAALEILTVAGLSAQAALLPLLIITASIIALAVALGVVINLLRRHDRKQQEMIEESEKKIKDFNNQLQESIWLSNRLAGSNAWQETARGIEIAGQIAEEARRKAEAESKKGKERDKEKEKEYLEEQKQAERERLDMLRQLRDEWAGTANDIGQRLTDAFIDAFAQGDNAARAWKDNVNSYIGDIIKKNLSDTLVKNQVQSLMDKTFGANFTDKDYSAFFSDADKVGAFNKELLSIGTNFEQVFKSIPDSIKKFLYDNEDSSLSSGIEGVTEDTARRIDAYMSSLLSEVVKGNNYMPQVQSQLVLIANNTHQMYELLNAFALGTKKMNVRMN